jgi:hypothetical protein
MVTNIRLFESLDQIQLEFVAVVLARYISRQHDSGINIQIVYTANTQTDFMRTVGS